MVQEIKHDEEVSVRFMQMFEEEEVIMERARKAGIEQGIEQGIDILIADNVDMGVSKELIISKLVKHFGLTVEAAQAKYDDAMSI